MEIAIILSIIAVITLLVRSLSWQVRAFTGIPILVASAIYLIATGKPLFGGLLVLVTIAGAGSLMRQAR
jgi:hypothetical protein